MCLSVQSAGPYQGEAFSKLYRQAAQLLDKRPVRFVAVFTDGGADMQLRQYAVNNMCAF